MKTVLVAKGGAVFRTASLAQSSGEQGETQAVIEHLISRGDVNVVYFGHYRGGALPGLTVVTPHTQGIDELSTGKAQEDAFRKDEAELSHYDPIAFIQTSGYAVTMSLIENPNGIQVQCASVKYTAPMLNVIRHFKIPRVVINNDPRNYPRDQEMSLCWPEVRPAALLDQWNASRSVIVGRRRYTRKSVYAACENWAWHKRIDVPKTLSCTAVAHAHINDGIKKGDDTAWEIVFGGGWPSDCQLYGRGWSDYLAWPWLGEIKPQRVHEILAMSRCGPIVSHTPGFYTGKLVVYLSQRCAPLFLGARHTHAYDPLERYLPMDSQFRIHKRGDLCELAASMESDEIREAYIDDLIEKTQPDFTVLDNLVDDLLDERPLVGYGGYHA